MPTAATLVQRGELEHLPNVFEVLRSGLPALADCRHQFLTETSSCSKCLVPAEHAARWNLTLTGKASPNAVPVMQFGASRVPSQP